MKDATMIKTAAMPNAANTVNTNSVQLPQQATRPFTGNIRVRLYNTVATGANSKNINYSLQASNEAAANFANVSGLAVFTVAGNAANHAASTREIALPPELNKSYLRASCTGEANGGDAGDGTFGLEIVA